MEPFIVEHDSALTVWGQVHRDLRLRIDAGEFAPGARIPTEVELIAHYDVSRITIRRATSALVSDGYVESRRGSGTYVRVRADVRCVLDLTKPWREQIVSTGHDAVTRLLEPRSAQPVPVEIARQFASRTHEPPTVFGRHVQYVDGIPIAITESWFSTFSGPDLVDALDTGSAVAARGFVEVGFATAAQAEILESFLDVPLIVVVTKSTLLSTGETVEVSRTSWLGSRVRLVYGRELTVDQIDMTQFMGRPASAADAPRS